MRGLAISLKSFIRSPFISIGVSCDVQGRPKLLLRTLILPQKQPADYEIPLPVTPRKV